MCKQVAVQNLSQKQAPNHLGQVKNQLKLVDQEVVNTCSKLINRKIKILHKDYVEGPIWAFFG